MPHSVADTRIFIALGSNLGDRAAALRAAVRALAALPATELLGVGGVYESAAVGGPAGQGAYLNTVVALRTRLTPRALLAACQAIEADAGRVRRERNEARPLDVDVLLVGGHAFATADYTVPHPRMAERWFVLQPLADLAPDLRPPGWERAVGERLAALEQEAPGLIGKEAPLVLR